MTPPREGGAIRVSLLVSLVSMFVVGACFGAIVTLVVVWW